MGHWEYNVRKEGNFQGGGMFRSLSQFCPNWKEIWVARRSKECSFMWSMQYVSQCDYFFSLVILEVSIIVCLVEILVLIRVVNKGFSIGHKWMKSMIRPRQGKVKGKRVIQLNLLLLYSLPYPIATC